jgi:hypothetical protein
MPKLKVLYYQEIILKLFLKFENERGREWEINDTSLECNILGLNVIIVQFHIRGE